MPPNIPSQLAIPFWIIRVAGFLVPRPDRDEWRREWQAELWHAAQGLEAGKLGERARLWGLMWPAFGAFFDAGCLWLVRLSTLRLRLEQEQDSARFCLLGLAGAIVFITLITGGLRQTRSTLMPPPFPTAEQLAIVTQGSLSLASPSPVPPAWISLWREKATSIDGAAGFLWRDTNYTLADREGSARVAEVDQAFFPLLGVHTNDGMMIDDTSQRRCLECVYVSYDFWIAIQKSHPSGRFRTILLDDGLHEIAGVLDARFRFLDPSIAIWKVSRRIQTRAAAIIRMAPGTTPDELQKGLRSVIEAAGVARGSSILLTKSLVRRQRAPLWAFALAWMLAVVMLLGILSGNRADRNVVSARSLHLSFRPRLQFGGFLILKILLLSSLVFIVGMEYTHANTTTMLGGAPVTALPLSTWLWLCACFGALLWSVSDQRRRCPACLRRLGLAAKVGCPGCVLFDWGGTEFVCVAGHGMLHVPDLVTCWTESHRWTPLDPSWQELFPQPSDSPR